MNVVKLDERRKHIDNICNEVIFENVWKSKVMKVKWMKVQDSRYTALYFLITTGWGIGTMQRTFRAGCHHTMYFGILNCEKQKKQEGEKLLFPLTFPHPPQCQILSAFRIPSWIFILNFHPEFYYTEIGVKCFLTRYYVEIRLTSKWK